MAGNYRNSAMMIPIYISHKQEKRSNKCFVYCFTMFVLLCFIALVFACVVVLVKKPTLTINSLTIDSLHYDTNTPSLNITARMEVTIQNSNFGHLVIDNNDNNVVSVVYGSGSVLGTSKLNFGNGRVAARGDQVIELMMDVSAVSSRGNFTALREGDGEEFGNVSSSAKTSSINNSNNNGTELKEGDYVGFNRDLSEGILELIGYALLKGEVFLFKNKIRRPAVAVMNCTIGIDLKTQTVQSLLC